MGDVRLLIGGSALALRGDFQRDLRRSAGAGAPQLGFD